MTALKRRGLAGMTGTALALSAVLALTGCGGPASQAAGQAGPQDITFLTNVPTEGLTWAPELVAETCGQFAQQGLNVNLQYINGAPAGVQALLADKALLVRPGDTDTMQETATGVPIVNVGAAQKGGSTLRIVSDRKHPLTSAASLNGKTMGVGSTGGSTKVTLDLLLATAGLKPEALTRQVVGLTPAVFNLVQTGKLDGYVVSLDTAIALRNQNPDAVVFNPADVITAGSNDYVATKAAVSDPAKSDRIRRFLSAIQAAMKFIIADKTDGYARTKKCIGEKYQVSSLKDPKVSVQALDAYVAAWTAGGADKLLQTDLAAWQRTYDEMVKSNLIAPGQDPTAWVTNDLVPASGS